MTTHTISVDQVDGVDEFDSVFTPRCLCGWTGADQYPPQAAVDDDETTRRNVKVAALGRANAESDQHHQAVNPVPQPGSPNDLLTEGERKLLAKQARAAKAAERRKLAKAAKAHGD